MICRLLKISLVILLTGLLLPSITSAAQSGPVMTGIPPAALVCLKPAIPFVWLRAAPSSGGQVVGTLFPADYQRLATTRQEKFDGYQWWLRVYAFPSSDLFLTGWIEESAFSTHIADTCGDIPVGAGVPAHPNLIGVVCLAPNVPFVFERPAPSYRALATEIVQAPVPCSSSELPPWDSMNQYYWDGLQWWVEIGHPPRDFSSRAWIEAKSLRKSGN